jgi:hypothetical protein
MRVVRSVTEPIIRLRDPDADEYEVEIDGVVKPLRRVTSILSKVTGGPKDGMAYYGGALATEYYTALLDEDYDEWYEEWKAGPRSPRAALKDAQERGKQAHKLFEDLISGEAIVTTKNGLKWVTYRNADPAISFVAQRYDLGALRAYETEIAPIITETEVLSEQKLYSLTYEYAGTADLIIPEFGLVGDLKTHNPPWRESDFLQMAAYSGAWEEMTGQVLDRQLVIIAKEDGNYEAWSGFMPPTAFLSLLPTHDALKGFRASKASESTDEVAA